MIDERRFSISHTSLWREITPATDRFIRHINLTSIRFTSPYKGKAKPHLNGAINETAFRLCKEKWNVGTAPTIFDEDRSKKLWIDVLDWLNLTDEPDTTFSQKVWVDILQICSNLYQFTLNQTLSSASFEPPFRGCGVVAECNGDLLIDETLVEVKAGARGFRATDLRQLFTYCALAKSSTETDIANVCLMNPRWGVSWRSSLEDAARGCGASSSVELLDEILAGTVSLGISR